MSREKHNRVGMTLKSIFIFEKEFQILENPKC